MKNLFKLSMMMVAAVAMLATSCKEDTPQNDTKPTVNLEVKSVTATEATLAVTATNVAEVYLYCAEEGDEPTTETIKVEGEKVVGAEATIGGLQSNTKYVAYALALNGDKIALASVPFATTATEFDGYEFNKLAQAVYRTDNDAVAGN